MARTYKDLSDHAVDRVTGGREESYAQDRARRVRHMKAGGRLARASANGATRTAVPRRSAAGVWRTAVMPPPRPNWPPSRN